MLRSCQLCVCVCVCACMHAYLHVCVCVCACMPVASLCVCVFVYVHLCEHALSNFFRCLCILSEYLETDSVQLIMISKPVHRFLTLLPMFTVTPEPTCAGSKFRCNSGMCIDIQNVCNRQNDCDDESDEQHCSECIWLSYPFCMFSAIACISQGGYCRCRVTFS